MGQSEVTAWLEAHPGWHNTRAIVAAMGRGYRGVSNNLRDACHWHDIESRRAEKGTAKEWRVA